MWQISNKNKNASKRSLLKRRQHLKKAERLFCEIEHKYHYIHVETSFLEMKKDFSIWRIICRYCVRYSSSTKISCPNVARFQKFQKSQLFYIHILFIAGFYSLKETWKNNYDCHDLDKYMELYSKCIPRNTLYICGNISSHGWS